MGLLDPNDIGRMPGLRPRLNDQTDLVVKRVSVDLVTVGLVLMRLLLVLLLCLSRSLPDGVASVEAATTYSVDGTNAYTWSRYVTGGRTLRGRDIYWRNH